MVSLQHPKLTEIGKTVEHAIVTKLTRYVADGLKFDAAASLVRSILLALAFVAGMTLCLLAVTLFIELHHVSSAYLIPVLIAAIRLGIVPAIVAAIGGVGASAFFFYPPIYDFRVSNPEQLLDLPLFVIVATVTSQLAARARVHAVLAQEREREMRALYAFSKRLAIATDAGQIYSAIQDHLSSITGCRVVYFEASAEPSTARHGDDSVPETIRRAVYDFAKQRGDDPRAWVEDQRTGTLWLIRAISQRKPAFGLVAIDVGRAPKHGHSFAQDRIDAVLADANATLERLDVARAIGEAKLRTEAETLRAALMGSVSHGLRTPLASIMGSASILVQAPVVMRDPHLAGLAGIVRDEAERLNSDIQRLLDASRISSAGVRPHLAWADVADVINAATASQRRRLSTHKLAARLSDDLPLVNVDPVLIEQALGQLLDNAAKYSPCGATIRIEALNRGGSITIAVIDEGPGLTAEELERMFERFYRGPRTRETTSGSGLGLWVARAFVTACGGTIEATSEGAGCGSVVTIALPEALTVMAGTSEGPDE